MAYDHLRRPALATQGPPTVGRGDREPLVSVIVPAFRAEKTLARAIGSVRAQSWQAWELILVSDDGVDYLDLLARAGLADPRIRQVSTGRHGSGCHRARNHGLAEASGDLIAALDADDKIHPSRLERLVPLALAHGAVSDNVRLVDEGSGRTLYLAMGDAVAHAPLGVAELLRINCPLFPVIRRDLARPRVDGIEYMEDVLSNLQLVASLGHLPVLPEPLYEYHVIAGSLSFNPDAGRRFDETYGVVIEALGEGEAYGIAGERRAEAIAAIRTKRALNRDYMEAALSEPGLGFHEFIARRIEA